MAIAGGNVVKILDVGSKYEELRAEAVELPLSQTVESTGWSRDGQVRWQLGAGQRPLCNAAVAECTVSTTCCGA
jgi:hypothetical protein